MLSNYWRLSQIAALFQTILRQYVDEDDAKLSGSAKFHWKPLNIPMNVDTFDRKLVAKLPYEMLGAIFGQAARPHGQLIVELRTPWHGSPNFEVVAESQKSVLGFMRLNRRTRDFFTGVGRQDKKEPNEEPSNSLEKPLARLHLNLTPEVVIGPKVVKIQGRSYSFPRLIIGSPQTSNMAIANTLTELGLPLSNTQFAGKKESTLVFDPEIDILYLNITNSRAYHHNLANPRLLVFAARCKYIAVPFAMLNIELQTGGSSPFLADFLAKMTGCKELIVTTGLEVTRSYVGQIPLARGQGKTFVPGKQSYPLFTQAWSSKLGNELKGLKDVKVWYVMLDLLYSDFIMSYETIHTQIQALLE